MTRTVLVSTVGTSLLTNQINRAEAAEKDWYGRLRDAANLAPDQTPEAVLAIIDTLKSRASQKLVQSSVAQIRAASAELNGVYGYYQEQLQQGSQDMNLLIATDTAQGQEAANLVKDFLEQQGINTQIIMPKGFSTENTEKFTEGIDQLISRFESELPGYKESGYQVCFNLVGSFKSLQGYLNTIGMFYADEIIYIFEGQGSEVIKIPRLPIAIDQSAIEPFAVQFALMEAGFDAERAELEGIQEALIYPIENDVTLSEWGKLIWKQAKKESLSGSLLGFPYLKYESSFIQDYKTQAKQAERVKLQETLARVSGLLIESNGSLAALRKDGGIQYKDYRNADVGHFRVSLELRVSCLIENGLLSLRRYGTHDHVERSEGVR
ncbi:putative CRISPR-associated protein [Romeria aff. gracilis LEGE 07310]|uniref:Putative CRISPR-associated protein n=1 Tax=Vasconcelosia minhoensis LEGE 07310 TaxID=915328 RepID=A0A8J7DP36_9CYAN|nr:putative CRISPR-associated protein [Romeria gracilis]MBE9079040.1 putative CRISPR-associated protein [Romeria aff. gracilis LEGE 07310]